MNMQSGFGDAGNMMAEQYIETMTNILLPVIERSTLLAAEYSKACGRDTLLPEDMEYAMKYCAMYTVGNTIGSTFPEIYEDSEDSEDEDMEVVDEDECPSFVRYSGSDPILLQVNDAHDRWNDWIPQNPTEQILKNAINSNEHMGA
jgi:histone H3/H4